MLKIAVCDDCRQFAEGLSELLQDFFIRMGVNCHFDIFHSGEDLIMTVDYKGIFDIIFLDIELTGMNGIETARYIRNRHPMAIIIFISSYSCYYAEAFDVQPFHYLMKPINPKQLYGILLRLCNFISSCQQVLVFDFNRIHYRINAGDIIYLESRRRVIQVVCCNITYQFYGKLTDVEKILSDYNYIFIRIHSSFLVNSRYITRCQGNQIYMANGDALPVSTARRLELKRLKMESFENIRPNK